MGTTPKRESLMSECAWREIPSTLPQDHSPSPCRCCHPLTSIIRCPPSVCCAERMSSLSPSKLSKKLTPSKLSSSKLVPSQPDQPDNGLRLTDAEADDISKQFTSAVISSALAEADAAAEAAAAEETAREVAAVREKEASVLKDWQHAELQRKSSAAASLTSGVLPAAMLFALLALAVYAAREAGAGPFAPPPEPEPEPSYFMTLLGLS